MNFVHFFMLFVLFFLSAAKATCPAEKVIPNRYLVRIITAPGQLKSFSSVNLPEFELLHKEFIRSLNTKSLSVVESSLFRANLDEAALSSLQATEKDIKIESDCYLELFAVPNDPDLSVKNNFWAQQQIRLPQAWDIIRESSVVVAVSDTGVDLDHPDLKENLWNNGRPGSSDFWGWAVPDLTNDPSPGNHTNSEHGTHVAGIIGAVGDNSFGVSGVAWKTKIMALRPFKQRTGELALSDAISSIRYAVDNGAKIINISWGQKQTPSAEMLLAAKYAEDNGVLLVAAAGNKKQDFSLFSPASIPSVVSVGSINSKEKLSTFTNFGVGLSVLAPGGDLQESGVGLNEGIFSTFPVGHSSLFGSKTGTSFAAPFVSGVAALARTLLPNLKNSELRRLLREGSDQVTFGFLGQNVTSYKLNAQKTLFMAYDLSKKNPTCEENCAFTSPTLAADEVEQLSFGGGCSVALPKTQSASVSIDFLWIVLCAFLFKKRKRKGRDKLSRPLSSSFLNFKN